MKRKHIYFSKEQIEALEKLSGTLAENVRTAVNEYLERHAPKAQKSPSITNTK